MTLHDLFTLLNLLIGTSGYDMTQLHYIYSPGINIGVQYIKYTSEYIPKLQIDQHSLLTMKVFSWHNLLAWVFFSISSRSSSSYLHLQVIFIFKSSSSSSLDHHWIIINITASAILIKWCYLSIILITGSSTEPSLFHAGCCYIFII